MGIKKLLKKYYAEIFIFLLGGFFGSFLMFSTFSERDGKLLIATKVWSDFASHIPLIKSFSLGSNFPPQYPLFPGEPIKYHFIFYAITGFLEKLGIRIDVALNILSAFGFSALVVLIYLVSLEIFKSKKVGILSVILFLFNSSLSFVYLVQRFHLSTQIINQVIFNKDFLSFSPYGPGIISAFWNLNIYTNQRHLAFSFALSLSLIYLLLRVINNKSKLSFRNSVFIGIVFGLLFYFHIAVFLMTVVVVFMLSMFFSEIRKQSLLILFIAAFLAFPQYKYLVSTAGYQMHFFFGFLVDSPITVFNFSQFWFYNLGLSIILIPFGFFLGNGKQRKILFSFFLIFIIGNAVQFSPEIAANHKFFNYFLLLGNMFSAYFLVKLWNNKKIIFKPIFAILLFFMVLGGIIDLFPIINDQQVELIDYKSDKLVSWIKSNTPPNSIFLNTTFLYDPASLAGRKIFLGWPYFAWSQGYDTNQRFVVMKEMLGGNNKKSVCNLLKENKIDYVEILIQNPPDPNIPTISNTFQRSFVQVFNSPLLNYSIYNVQKSCR